MEYNAVTHITRKSPEAVFTLGGSLHTNITANADIFGSPRPTMDVLGEHLSALNDAMKVKDGSKLKNQLIWNCTDLVYNDIKDLKMYVNDVAKGDKAIILQSGFDCNADRVKHGIPGKVVIKRIEDGSKVNSGRIYIKSLLDADRYKVEMTYSLQDPVWVTLLDSGVYNKMELCNLPHGVEIFLRVTGGNTRGWGIPSEPISFIPR